MSLYNVFDGFPTCTSSGSRDSFIRRLRQFVLGAPQHLSVDFDFSRCYQMARYWGHTNTKTVQQDLHVTESFNLDIVIIQLGSCNDLTSKTALRIGTLIEDFVRLLHDVYHAS